MFRRFRSIALVLVLLILSSAAAYARPLTGQFAPENLLSGFWNRLVSVFLPVPPADPGASPHSRWEKEGSSMDPNGQPQNGTVSGDPTSDAGSQMDPNG